MGGAFGGIETTYLRVTLGIDRRNGIGIPFVLEIWPVGHRSAIHNHGNTCAIIKVLHGSINITVFNRLSNPTPEHPKIIKKFDANAGQCTWLDPNWYQTHQLTNIREDFCATIQCYQYMKADRVHYPGFDFIAPEDPEPDIFYPDSDWSFDEFQAIVLQEYREYLKNRPIP